ncbi:hypothetical protein K440DRAFT_664990 [Wilcoxina mikolae CBS 423.85]|nr:hypothetical protein K440DRAFT_664990 [Wilcoxina mikolae CBS 423.85]
MSYLNRSTTRLPNTKPTGAGNTAGIPHHQNIYDFLDCVSNEPGRTQPPSPPKTKKRKSLVRRSGQKGTTPRAEEEAKLPEKRDNETAGRSTTDSDFEGQLNGIFHNALEEMGPFISLNVHHPEGKGDDEDLVFVPSEDEGDAGVIALDDTDDGGGWGSEMIERVPIDW